MVGRQLPQAPDPAHPLVDFTEGDSWFTPSISPLLLNIAPEVVTGQAGLLTSAIQSLAARWALRRDTRYKFVLVRRPLSADRRLTSAPDAAVFRVFDSEGEARTFARDFALGWAGAGSLPKGPSLRQLQAEARHYPRGD